jgi:hypothetical protein
MICESSAEQRQLQICRMRLQAEPTATGRTGGNERRRDMLKKEEQAAIQER